MVQAAPAWRSAGRTFFDQPRQVLTVAGNGLASYRLSDAVLRGREIADVSAAEERNRVAPGGKSVAPMLENLCGGQMSSRSSVNRQCIRSPFAPDRSRLQLSGPVFVAVAANAFSCLARFSAAASVARPATNVPALP